MKKLQAPLRKDPSPDKEARRELLVRITYESINGYMPLIEISAVFGTQMENESSHTGEEAVSDRGDFMDTS